MPGLLAERQGAFATFEARMQKSQLQILSSPKCSAHPNTQTQVLSYIRLTPHMHPPQKDAYIVVRIKAIGGPTW